MTEETIFSSGRVPAPGESLAEVGGVNVHAGPAIDGRLVALIPPPRFHMVRYHGVLAAHANARSEVVPGRVPAPAKPTQLRLFAGEATELEPGCASPSSTKPSNRHPWAWLLQRVFAVDVMTCPRCRGAMKLVEIANEREAIARALANAGLGPRPPPRPRPPLPGQLQLKFAA